MRINAGRRKSSSSPRWCVAACAIVLAAFSSAGAQTLPERLSDSTYWNLVNDISEPDGYFRSDNFASNEWSFQWVIPELNRVTKPGGVYMGVGPDQNFTYIVALKPKMAFIVDIRRQNMMLHLMYKAAMEMSPNRAAFLSLLFSRPAPAGLTDTASANTILDAVYRAPREMRRFEQNLAAIKEHITVKRGFKLSASDMSGLDYVYGTFYSVGPGITYQGTSGTPTYWDLAVETDGQGAFRSYVANEANYQFLREMQLKNLIVPVVGDFGGPRAIRKVGEYLKQHNATVTAFYLSNVEQYLFQYGTWSYFYASAATLPLDSGSTFIRSVFNNQGGFVANTAGRPASLLASMTDQLRAFTDGRLSTYQQVISTSREPRPLR